MAQIIGLFGAFAPQRHKKTWTNQDLAELYRVQSSLVQAGLKIDTEKGETDEGDPWFIFCHAESGEVIVHFAHIDGQYVVATPALPNLLSGPDLEAIVRKFVAENPVSLPQAERERRGNVVFHPSALLTIFVATLLLTFRPDESLAAGGRALEEADNDFSLSGSSSKLAAFPFGDEPRDLRTGEKAFLFAAVAMAIEIARVQGQEQPDSFIQLSSLENMFQALHLESGSEAGLAELILDALNSYGDMPSAMSATDMVEAAEMEFVELAALIDQEIGFANEDAAIHVDVQAVDSEKLQTAEDNLVFDDEPFTVGKGRPDASLAPVAVAPEGRGAAAADWLEEKASSAGLSIALLEQSSSAEAAIAVKLVDSAELVDGNVEAKPIQASLDGPVSLIAFLDDFNEKEVFRVIDYFLKSDDDIEIVGYGEGSVVIFDRSDVAEQKSLQMYIWAFEDTKISILAHSDTVADALSLMA